MLILALSAAPALAQTPTPQAENTDPMGSPLASPNIAALVEQLGDNSFARREDASAALFAAGFKAYDAVKAAQENDDAEIRIRARVLFRRIENKAFIDGDIEAPLSTRASWRRLVKIMGDTAENRELFLAMHTQAELFLVTYQDQPDQYSDVIKRLLPGETNGQIAENKVSPSVLKAILFASVSDTVSLDQDAAHRIRCLLQYRYTRYDKTDKGLGKLVGLWIRDGLNKFRPSMQERFFVIAAYFQLQQVRLAVSRVAMDRGRGKWRSSRWAAEPMLFLREAGNTSDIRVLDRWSSDDKLVGKAYLGGKLLKECRTGDIALGVCVELSGQKLSDYPAPNAKVDPDDLEKIITGDSYIPLRDILRYGFRNDEEREAARQKWSQWRKAQKKRSDKRDKPDLMNTNLRRRTPSDPVALPNGPSLFSPECQSS